MKKVAQWTVWGVLFLIPFIPLYVSSSLYFPFITGKGFAFRILIDIALAAYLLLACMDAKYRPKFSWILILYAAFTAWMLIADLFAVNVHKALWSNFERMDGFVTLAHVFAFFIIAGAVLTADKLWRRWWLTFLSAAALVCGYGLVQLSGGAVIHQGGARVDASFGNAAYLAAYMLFVAAIAVWQALETGAGKLAWIRYALFALAGIAAFIVYETQTRGAVLGLIAGIAVAALLWMLEAGKKGRLVAGAVLAGILLLVGGFFLVKDSAFVKADPTLARVSSISAHDLSVRTALWTMAFTGVLERPVTGYGQEGFNYIFQKDYQPSMYAQEPWFDRAHNTFVDWLVAGGFPALLLFLALLISAVIALYRRTATRPERVLLVAALAAYAVQALVVFDNLFTYIPLAALLAMAATATARPWKLMERIPEVGREQAGMVGAPIALVLGAALVWFVNVPSIAGASALVHGLAYLQSDPERAFSYITRANEAHAFGDQEIAEQTLMFATGLRQVPGASDQLKQEAGAYAMTRMNELVSRVPNDARIHMVYASGLRLLGDKSGAMRESTRARELSPKKQAIYIEQAYVRLETGDFTGARDLFHEAYALDTSFTDLAVMAAAGDIFAGDVTAGQALLTEAVGTTAPANQLLVLAYYQAKRFDDMIAVLAAQKEANDSIETRFRLAQGYAAGGRYSDARREAQNLARTYPEAAASAAGFIAQLPR